MQPTNDQLVVENSQLKSVISELRAENLNLRRKVEYLERHPVFVRAVQGETIIAQAVGAAVTEHNAACDLIVGGSLLRIEVKYSRLNDSNRGRPTKKTMRWAWAKIFGESGNKKYERLILVGQPDERFRSQYLDPDSPYVVFDIPFAAVLPLTITTNGGRFRSIQLTTNPSSARSTASVLFQKYQVTLPELEARYRI